MTLLDIRRLDSWKQGVGFRHQQELWLWMLVDAVTTVILKQERVTEKKNDHCFCLTAFHFLERKPTMSTEAHLPGTEKRKAENGWGLER